MSSTAPPVVLGTGNNILINPLQRGNTVLDNIKNVGKEFGDIVADYQVGRTTGVLFLSLKYHRLHPEYVHIRIGKLGQSYTLRLLLVLCDITEHRDAIRELTKVCLINNITILVAFSFEEAGHYLSILKQFEHKPPDMIKERSFANIAKATPDQLRNLPGFGQVKVKNIKNTFDKPLRNNATRTLPAASGSDTATVHPATPSNTLIKGKGKDTTRLPRDLSPVWDIERSPSPEYPPHPFDIDLDLN
ncbi:hypothetical protein C0991_005603 [Blastosporella zonata]|nr:hypothetical protein C0991_005603 [Blastosporella zonata]